MANCLEWRLKKETKKPVSRNCPKNKSSEVVLSLFVSASSSRSTLARPAVPLPLRALCMRSALGLRAYRQPDKPTQRLGTLSCLRLGFPFSSTSALL